MQLLRIIAFPFSLIYALVVYIRNAFYDIELLPSAKFKTPIICVGNLSVGGTGKTPMIEWLLHNLSDDLKLAVLSRGYKRKSNGFVLAQPSTTAEDIGDEPLQIYSKFPESIIAVDANRKRGIKKLERSSQPDLILLDDAYQHRKVRPSFSILLTSYVELYTQDWYLPTGNLRDIKSASKRADIIVVTKCPPAMEDENKISVKNELKPGKNQEVLFCTLEYDPILKGKEEISLEDLQNEEITLVTGIAKPKPLIDFLSSEKIRFDHQEYRDHHFFTSKEIDFLNSKPLVLTTEKDYMRLKGKVDNLYYLTVRHRFLDEGKQILIKKLEKLSE